jgi:hypothetical protein
MIFEYLLKKSDTQVCNSMVDWKDKPAGNVHCNVDCMELQGNLLEEHF